MKPAAHFALAAAQRDELPAATGETWGIQITASESWDAASGTRNASSGTVGTVWEWGSDKLSRLREERLRVAFGMQAQKTYLALVILLHFIRLILVDDGLIN
jgi:hypothetical protein